MTLQEALMESGCPVAFSSRQGVIIMDCGLQIDAEHRRDEADRWATVLEAHAARHKGRR